jgi:hypothetical protein
VISESTGVVSIVCCSIFRKEVGSLCAACWPQYPVYYLDSMLHMRPQLLESEIVPLVQRERNAGRKVLLIYGDCCPGMTQLEALAGVVRVVGHNCCYLLLGRERYRQLSHEGAFFLLPEWIHRWREIFRDELGLNHENATGFMRNMHRKLVYLDTGAIPVPDALLEACSDYCGLPFEILPIPLDTLKSSIETAVSRLEMGEGAF